MRGKSNSQSQRFFLSSPASLFILTLLLISLGSCGVIGNESEYQMTEDEQRLLKKAGEEGTVRIIVKLNVDYTLEGELPDMEAVTAQREAISNAQESLLSDLASYNITSVSKFKSIPYMAMTVDDAGLRALFTHLMVSGIEEDTIVSAS